MRRWLVLALAPTGLLGGHALIGLSGGVVSGVLLTLVLVAVEAIALAWLGGSLVAKWPALPHERWTLPIGIALGFLPWALLAGSVTLTLIGWTAGSLAIASLVGVLRSRSAIRWTAVTGGVSLVMLIPFLVMRGEYGSDVPWWSAPLWAPSAILGAAYGPVGMGVLYELTLITMMALFGSALYLATLVTRASSTVDRIPW